MAIDMNLLPSEATTQKGVFFYPGNRRTTYGTILTLSRDMVEHPEKYRGEQYQDWVEVVMPEVYGMLTAPRREYVQTGWYSDDFDCAYFILYSLSIEHGAHLPFVGDDVFTNDAVQLLLSGMLQTGERANYRNMGHHRSGRGEKYLPLTIGKEHLHYHVYMPTPQRVADARERFKEALGLITPILPSLPNLMKLTYAAVRLSEVREASDVVPTAYADVEAQIEDILGPYTKQLGFVYQDLPGPQDTVHFFYEMLAERKD